MGALYKPELRHNNSAGQLYLCAHLTPIRATDLKNLSLKVLHSSCQSFNKVSFGLKLMWALSDPVFYPL